MRFDPQRHHRRSIRLKGYDYTQAGAYFVTLITHQRECILGEIVAEEMRASPLGEIAAACWDDLPHHFTNAALDAWVVMPNHLHGIVVITTEKSEASAQTAFGSAAPHAADASPLPGGWRWVRLGDVIAEAQPGFASGERDPNGVIQLRMNNVNTRGRLMWNEFIRVPATEAAISKYALRHGDVVFNNTNSVELVGKSAFFEGHTEPIVYSNHFTRLRVADDLLDPRYLSFWLVEQWQERVFENLCNRWIGQSAVKNDKLLALSIPLPPLPEQRRIAAILNEQMAAVEKARAAAEAQLAVIEQLPGALLRRAMRGEM